MKRTTAMNVMMAAIGVITGSLHASAQWTSNGGHGILTDATKSVGIGISTVTTPLGKLQVLDGSVLFNGTTGSTPTTGAGVRLMWIPAKGAFRAGEVNTSNPTYWDDASIGANSFAAGYSVKASGARSVAMGGYSSVSGISGVAIGHSHTVTGDYGVAFGYQNTVAGANGVAMGALCSASGDYGVAMGDHTTARTRWRWGARPPHPA